MIRLLAGLALALLPSVVVAQAAEPRALSLAEALRLAEDRSEQVEMAEAGVVRAEGDVLRARAARLPQLNASASYSRTLASQFEGLGGGGEAEPAPVPPGCLVPFQPNPALPLEERVAALEAELRCPPAGPFGGIDFDQIGFGAENTYNLGLSFSVPLYTGGRLPAQAQIARAGRQVAEIGLTSARAQLRLDVTQAYYNAQLADQLVEISEAALAQAEETLRLTELRAREGELAEFDVLRARVAVGNLRPAAIQARAQRDLAYDRLRLFLDLPLDEQVVLTSLLQEVEPEPVSLDTTIARAPVRQAAQGVVVQEGQVEIAVAQRLPNLVLTSQYGRVAFGDLSPTWSQFRENWSVGAAIQVPVFTGGRIRGDVLSARASLEEAEAQLQQARELALLDTRNALAQLEAARATWEANLGGVEQAERAYEIAELRYREGLSTQTELAEVRLALQQARTNRVSSARDLLVAQTRVELLPYLPITTPSGIAPNANAGVPNGAGSSRAAQTQPPVQQPQVTTQGAGAPAGSGVTPPGGGAPQ